MPPTGWPSQTFIKRLPAAEFTRPSDTTQYTAGDSVGPVTTPAIMTFANATGARRMGKLRAVRLSKSTATVTLAQFRLWLYNASVTAIADNAAWTTLYADREKLIGYVDLPLSGTMVALGGSSATVLVADANISFELTSGRTLYGVLQAIGAYTPASAETFSVSLTVEQI